MIPVRYLPALFAGILTACATAQPLNTPSGLPEVTIKGKTQAEVMDAVVAECAVRGLNIENQTISTVVCGREASMGMQVLIGNSYGSTPQSKVQFVVVKQSDGVKISAPRAWNESSNGFGAMQRYDSPLRGTPNGVATQQMLEVIVKNLSQ